MKALAELSADHRIFEGLLDALERLLSDEEEAAHARVERLLKALRQGLAEHQAAEALLFGAGRKHPSKGALRREHEDLSEVREALDFIIEIGVEENFSALKETVRHLDERLRRHFKLEEEALWPAMRSAAELPRKTAAEVARRIRAIARLKEEAAL
ncbi:MAG: hypothetical protein HYV15_03440 [Elusimicrobia bacterium]|nr:hypothetical protein [Elusimicrobiota bacterium]